MTSCEHLDTATFPAVTDPADGAGCTDCLALGGRWVHLRTCLECGHIGCCDSSPARHATAHARETGHPVVQSHEPGESWRYCYVDQVTA
jgi:uncharacterized UBP type Zn finger protein